MSEKSGFFNALNIDGAYDRTYNANDYCDNLAVVISNGVLRTADDDLRVTASGLIPTVAAGRAWINGHYYVNDTEITLAPVTAPVGGSRYDRIILRLDNTLQQRRIYLVYVEGAAGNTPKKPEPLRNDRIFDLVLADLYITANAESMTVTDTRGNTDLCGWVYSTSGDSSFFKSLDNSFLEWFKSAKDTLSSVTLFKRYTQNITLDAPASAVSFNIPQYDPETCFAEVYVNGMLDTSNTVDAGVITFQSTLIAGTVITVNAYKSIDGTGIETAADEITELQNKVATVSGVSNYTYKCTGVDDNIALSQIAQALISGSYAAGNVTAAAKAFLEALGGGTFLSALDKQGQIQIDVVGKCGATTAFSGTGTDASKYKYFVLGAETSSDKRVVFDFAKCDKITIDCKANTSNIIFYGQDLYVRNAAVYAQSAETACNITMIAGMTDTGTKQFDNCRFTVKTSGSAVIARNGTYNNCNFKAFCKGGSSAICFYPQSAGGLIRVYGGTYCSYTAASGGAVNAIVYVETGQADAVLFAENIHCPQITETGYEQKNLVNALSGTVVINNVVSKLTNAGAASSYTVTNQINKNKA